MRTPCVCVGIGSPDRQLDVSKEKYEFRGSYSQGPRVLTGDSITVSSAWELTSVSMRYSQGDGVNTSLSRISYCTHSYSCLSTRVRVCVSCIGG